MDGGGGPVTEEAHMKGNTSRVIMTAVVGAALALPGTAFAQWLSSPGAKG